jgi:intron-binding protein aquarius
MQDIFQDRPEQFPVLFRRILSLNLDNTLPSSVKLWLLSFVITAFQSLEKPVVRKECAPLVSISIWHNLHCDAARNKVLDQGSLARKAWRAACKRYEAADNASKAGLRFDRSWLFTMLLDFIRRVNESGAVGGNTAYCERFLEFLVDLVSQLPTRRYTNALIKDLNLLTILRLSHIFEDERNSLIRDQSELLGLFIQFSVDEQGGQSFKSKASYDLHCQALFNLQKEAMKHFEGKLKVLALSNCESVARRSELESHLSPLSVEELERLCSLLYLRTQYPRQVNLSPSGRLYLETLLAAFEPPLDAQSLGSRFSILPTEKDLYDPSLFRTEAYDGSQPLPIPKFNLQYLSLGDFLWRSFLLYRSEACFEIRKDVESVVKRMRPRPGADRKSVRYDGFSKLAVPIPQPAIIEVAPAQVGSSKPAFVRAEILLDLSRLNDNMRAEWDSLRPNDVVFLLSVKAEGRSSLGVNGNATFGPEQDWEIEHVRAAEMVQLLDGNGRPLRDAQMPQTNGYVARAAQRRLLVNLDSVAYKADLDRIAKGKPEIYSSLNVLARRNRRENNFKPTLDTMRSLVAADTHLPVWFRDSFLGYGDPQSSNYSQLSNKIRSLDYRDTFLNWQHLEESFPKRSLQPAPEFGSSFPPPYLLQLFDGVDVTEPVNPKKRRREQMETPKLTTMPVKVSSYRPRNTGPYPMDAPRLNTIRFTPAQTQAITSGTQPGLSVIIGPPGTGKTDVATQIINLLYHNFPSERILLVAHSNQALNQLFQKIIALDIDSRHLLRLGHGEEDLDTEASYSKHGRVESFMDNRSGFLSEVDRLAASINVQGAHGNSCETADYFNKVYIQPAWSRFWDQAHSANATCQSITKSFPFHVYFANAPNQPLFSSERAVEDLIATAAGCEHHISRIFTELESIRPFEFLRQPKDKANYLLVKEARIIAMTSTHAAIRRSEIASLGFSYDTLIMEEAAQITEIESFVPCAMQDPNPQTGELPLKRIVLVGDHLQNAPIIQNLAFRQYANFEQSLFLRLVRLGVPTITLDQQGRCRPSIAELFQWRYPSLTSLPKLRQQPEFARANAGFRYDFQFIDVPDYQGQGEREPSPHFIQNLGEAEYATALYQYMRLLGYPPHNISILAAYAGQRALIRDVLEHRCKGNSLFGLPRMVTTVDKYQGEQNDYIILSLTRTKSVGYLRDVRRLTVALSRARLGLYILGRQGLFESCFEMRPAMGILERRPSKLLLTTGEMHPAQRLLEDEVDSVEMDGVEHLGQYVYEMTQAKVKALGREIAVVRGGGADREGYAEEADGGGVGLDEGEEEEDPLHEQVAP